MSWSWSRWTAWLCLDSRWIGILKNPCNTGTMQLHHQISLHHWWEFEQLNRVDWTLNSQALHPIRSIDYIIVQNFGIHVYMYIYIMVPHNTVTKHIHTHKQKKHQNTKNAKICVYPYTLLHHLFNPLSSKKADLLQYLTLMNIKTNLTTSVGKCWPCPVTIVSLLDSNDLQSGGPWNRQWPRRHGAFTAWSCLCLTTCMDSWVCQS